MSRIHDSQILVYFEPQNDKFLSSGIGHMNEKLCRNKVSNKYQYSKLISNVRMRLSVSTLEKWNVERVTVYISIHFLLYQQSLPSAKLGNWN